MTRSIACFIASVDDDPCPGGSKLARGFRAFDEPVMRTTFPFKSGYVTEVMDGSYPNPGFLRDLAAFAERDERPLPYSERLPPVLCGSVQSGVRVETEFALCLLR